MVCSQDSVTPFSVLKYIFYATAASMYFGTHSEQTTLKISYKRHATVHAYAIYLLDRQKENRLECGGCRVAWVSQLPGRPENLW